MNEHDSETLAGMLIEKGYVPAAERKDANIVIFNTCSIREMLTSVSSELWDS